jgi:hypothetical protein
MILAERRTSEQLMYCRAASNGALSFREQFNHTRKKDDETIQLKSKKTGYNTRMRESIR